jgi:hypothetical protein
MRRNSQNQDRFSQRQDNENSVFNNPAQNIVNVISTYYWDPIFIKLKFCFRIGLFTEIRCLRGFHVIISDVRTWNDEIQSFSTLTQSNTTLGNNQDLWGYHKLPWIGAF